MTGQLHVDADLRLQRGDDAFDVWSEGSLVVVNAPSLAALVRARSLTAAVDRLPVGTQSLPDDPPSVELRVRHAPVARFDPDQPGTPGIDALVGVDARVAPKGLLTAAIRAFG